MNPTNGNLPVGTVVRALRDIKDYDVVGNEYFHAKKGDTGVVNSYHWPDGPVRDGVDGADYPTINWNAGTGLGYFDCHVGTAVEEVSS